MESERVVEPRVFTFPGEAGLCAEFTYTNAGGAACFGVHHYSFSATWEMHVEEDGDIPALTALLKRDVLDASGGAVTLHDAIPDPEQRSNFVHSVCLLWATLELCRSDSVYGMFSAPVVTAAVAATSSAQDASAAAASASGVAVPASALLSVETYNMMFLPLLTTISRSCGSASSDTTSIARQYTNVGSDVRELLSLCRSMFEDYKIADLLQDSCEELPSDDGSRSSSSKDDGRQAAVANFYAQFNQRLQMAADILRIRVREDEDRRLRATMREADSTLRDARDLMERLSAAAATSSAPATAGSQPPQSAAALLAASQVRHDPYDNSAAATGDSSQQAETSSDSSSSCSDSRHAEILAKLDELTREVRLTRAKMDEMSDNVFTRAASLLSERQLAGLIRVCRNTQL